jgi:hypothetical protein
MATWTNQSKTASSWTNGTMNNLDLLIEGTFRLLSEGQYGLLIEPATAGAFEPTAKNASSWTNQTMN